MLQFSLIFMTPGTWNLAKSDFTIFSNFHDPGYMKNPQKLDPFIFFNFHEPGRVHENKQKSDVSIFSNFQFTWKSTKIRPFDFLQLLWPQVHKKSDTSISSTFMTPYMKVHKIQTYMKVHKNQTLCFSSTFMTPGTGKSAKIRHFNFLQLSWPRVHESSQKSDALILFNFHDPGYMKVQKNHTLWFYSIFMNPDTWKFTKIRRFNFYSIFMTRVHESWRKLKRLIFVDFPVPGAMKIE